jgi:hypothetical protein
MTIEEILQLERKIWGKRKLKLSEIIVRMGKVFGDICRWERNAIKDKDIHNDKELQKELGNIINSTIKWCDDLGYKPEDCINESIKCHKKFTKHIH